MTNTIIYLYIHRDTHSFNLLTDIKKPENEKNVEQAEISLEATQDTETINLAFVIKYLLLGSNS